MSELNEPRVQPLRMRFELDPGRVCATRLNLVRWMKNCCLYDVNVISYTVKP